LKLKKEKKKRKGQSAALGEGDRKSFFAGNRPKGGGVD